MPIDLVEFALVTGVIMIGAATQAAIGMGLNLFAIPLLLLLNPIYAPGPVLVASFVLSCLALWRVPAHVDTNELKIAGFGLLVGSVVAGLVASMMDSSNLTRLLGVFIVVGVGLALSGWSAAMTQRNLIAAGSASGFLGTIAGVHAPPIALLYQGLEPNRVRGAILSLIAIGNLFSILTLIGVGQFGRDEALASIRLWPGVVAGVLIAPLLVALINANTLRILILAISAISGLLLVFR